MLKALSTFGQVQKCRPWGNVFGDLHLNHFPAKIETFSSCSRDFFGHAARHVDEVAVPRELCVAIRERIQRIGVPPTLLRRV